MNRYFIENSNIVLRKILNQEGNLDIVKEFIEAILGIKVKKVILRPYLRKKSESLPDEEKYGIVNVRIFDEKDNETNVGIQIIDGIFLQEKILIYGATIHAYQNEYEEHSDIVNTITINIVDYKGFQTPNYHKIIAFSTKCDEGVIVNRDDLVFHILQLVDYDKEEPSDKEEEWIEYLKGENQKRIEKILEKNSAIKKLDKELKEFWKLEKI